MGEFTKFMIHFGEDGTNTVFHNGALEQWLSKPGQLVVIHESDKDLVQKTNPTKLVPLPGGRLGLKADVVEVAEVSEVVEPKFNWEWVRIAAAVAAGTGIGAWVF